MDNQKEEQKLVVDMMTEGYLSSFRQIEKVLGRVSTTFGIGWSGLSILNQLATNPNVNVSDMAAKNHVTKGAISIQISELMKDGLIEMAEDPNDRRHHIIKLTKKGQKMADREVAQAKAMAAKVLNNMGEAEMMRLHTDFAAFAHLLEDTKLE
ncbi:MULTISPECIES: MarR family transcriptional regulator [Furfurilactobacillus]|uniref:MarR family transcriptional regulator n=1 Tax=Furfurilactobacillus rossiae TaxID=231049 RepID=A0A7C9IU04_9LACO|nr:MarR family transcriptional regulator [Furfurilactobacillus milii]